MLAPKICDSDSEGDYLFYVLNPVDDIKTWDTIMEVMHNDNCTECFYLEECVAKVQKILSDKCWTDFDNVIIEDRVMHS